MTTTVGEGIPAGEPPRDGGRAGARQAGQSGEGARSALEQLIQQERRRDAQLPLRDGAERPPGDSRGD